MTDLASVLEKGLKAAAAWEEAPEGSHEADAAAERATGALVLIDSVLSSGGDLPPPWEAARHHGGKGAP